MGLIRTFVNLKICIFNFCFQFFFVFVLIHLLMFKLSSSICLNFLTCSIFQISKYSNFQNLQHFKFSMLPGPGPRSGSALARPGSWHVSVPGGPAPHPVRPPAPAAARPPPARALAAVRPPARANYE